MGRRTCENGNSAVIYVMFCMIVISFMVALSLGGFTAIDNELLPYAFLNTRMHISSIPMFNRLMGTPLVFLFKFTYSTVRQPKDLNLLTAPLLRRTVRKGDVATEMLELRRRRSTLALLTRERSSLRHSTFGSLARRMLSSCFRKKRSAKSRVHTAELS